MLWKMIDVADNERALVYRRNRLATILMPGRQRLWALGQDLRVEHYDITAVEFNHPRLKFLLRQYQPLFDGVVDAVQLTDREVGLVYRDGKLADILPPGGLLATWRGGEQVSVSVVDITSDYQIGDDVIGLLGRGATLANNRTLAQAISYSEVPDEQVGMLFVNGKLEKMLTTGRYGFWLYNRSISVKLVDLRLQTLDVSGQEILTKDRVSLRINLTASFKIVDAKSVALQLKDYLNFLYLELQLRLREAVGTKNLDELLVDKDLLNAVIAEGVRNRVTDYGINLLSVGVKDIILPGDMKQILNQVVEAQKEAEANLIKRHEETQAMRSLHNTAKVMENNPVLLRLKELEALERITTKIDKISVYGGLDSVLHGLVKLAPATSAQ
ncbi:slipin family protein [Halioxenophilus sp. WMMB6]|uniref:slipin family protein n=1 Tax=Halioxenophilus sp. WMMB6 TaxID=3073815 RepID=UPI00295F5387|nr:slipin family protein [Halioxenophilus sp. WMMB6]